MIESIDPQRRQFFFLQLIGPHGPYVPSARARAALGIVFDPLVEAKIARDAAHAWYAADDRAQEDYLRSLYDAEILDEDAHLAPLLDAIDARLSADRSLVVFTSDHGEAFGEHGQMEHGNSLFHEELHVPLIIRGVAVEPGRYDRLAGPHDVAPTILRRLGLAAPPSFSGIDLFGPDVPERVLRLREFREVADDVELYGVIARGQKAIWSPVDAGVEHLFEDWRRDDFALDRADGSGYELAELRRRGGPDPERALPITLGKLSNDTERALRALGYVE